MNQENKNSGANTESNASEKAGVVKQLKFIMEDVSSFSVKYGDVQVSLRYDQPLKLETPFELPFGKDGAIALELLSESKGKHYSNSLKIWLENSPGGIYLNQLPNGVDGLKPLKVGGNSGCSNLHCTFTTVTDNSGIVIIGTMDNTDDDLA